MRGIKDQQGSMYSYLSLVDGVEEIQLLPAVVAITDSILKMTSVFFYSNNATSSRRFRRRNCFGQNWCGCSARSGLFIVAGVFTFGSASYNLVPTRKLVAA
jgi:hypothetical protein